MQRPGLYWDIASAMPIVRVESCGLLIVSANFNAIQGQAITASH